MLVQQINETSRTAELHWLGKLNLGFQVENPSPRETIPNHEHEVDIGPIYYDSYLSREVEHDFYYTYEKLKGKRGIIEKVSFTKPIKILRGKYNKEGLCSILTGAVHRQHPAVTDYDYHSELADFDIPSGSVDFFRWEYRKYSYENITRRNIYNSHYSSFIPEHMKRNIRNFVPSELFEPLYKCAPLYVLDVLGMVDFGPFEAVPSGYYEYFKPRLSQKLLNQSNI